MRHHFTHDFTSAVVAKVVTAAALVAVLIALRRSKGRLRLPWARGPLIAYLNTEPAEKWRDQLDVFARALSLPKRCFVQYDCFNGEFPTQADIDRGRFIGVLVTGSAHSAVDTSLPWLAGLFACLRACAAVSSLNVLGCCFGCQAAAVAFGGSVGTNPTGRFVFGTERIALDSSRIAQHGWAAEALAGKATPSSSPPTSALPSAIWLLQSHGEQVLKLPPSATLLGWSGTAPNELFLAGEHANVLCCQAHPEFDVPLVRERIEPALRAKGRLTPDEWRAAEDSMQSRPLHSDAGRSLYRAFLLRGAKGGGW